MKSYDFRKSKRNNCRWIRIWYWKITLETNIQDDLGADSLDAVELIMSIEDEFDIMIPDDAAMEVKTVAQLVKLIEAETNKVNPFFLE